MLAAAALPLAGCGPSTKGELRRRQLTNGLLLAWVLGLAMLWRRWVRRERERTEAPSTDRTESHST